MDGHSEKFEKVFEKIKLNPDNPRTITKIAFKRLKESIKRFPEMLEKRPIVYDENFVILGGNQRMMVVKELVKEGFKIKPEYFDQAIDWTEEQKREFIIRDNLADGEWDTEILANKWDTELLAKWGLDFDFGNKDLDDLYTSKVETPIYEPSERKPLIDELVDKSKVDNLLKEINESDISDEEKEFLKIAAYRHYVFDYSRIADFYAHSEAKVQRLMEKSALVIVDLKSAIANGYVKLVEEIAENWTSDHEA